MESFEVHEFTFVKLIEPNKISLKYVNSKKLTKLFQLMRRRKCFEKINSDHEFGIGENIFCKTEDSTFVSRGYISGYDSQSGVYEMVATDKDNEKIPVKKENLYPLRHANIINFSIIDSVLLELHNIEYGERVSKMDSLPVVKLISVCLLYRKLDRMFSIYQKIGHRKRQNRLNVF